MSTPSTSKPARAYPMAIPPAPEYRSSSRGGVMLGSFPARGSWLTLRSRLVALGDPGGRQKRPPRAGRPRACGAGLLGGGRGAEAGACDQYRVGDRGGRLGGEAAAAARVEQPRVLGAHRGRKFGFLA